MIALLWLLGCSTLSTLQGARTLEPGQAQLNVGLGLQAGASPATQAGIPLPQLELAGRIGVAEDLDLGFQLYLLGAGADARYRLWHDDRWHLASGFGVAGMTLLGAGSIESRVPLTAEYIANRRISVAFGPRLILRDQWNRTDGGPVARVDVFAGGMARTEFTFGKVILGVGGDVYARPTRWAPAGWAGTVSLGWRGSTVLRSPDDEDGQE